MRQQVIHIHGGHIWNEYEEYLQYLKTVSVDPHHVRGDRWSRNHDHFLNPEHYDIWRLDMPGKFNAKYNEWKIWFERYLPFMEDNIILIGHSLGGQFLAKYLSENILPVSINQLHLVAPSHTPSKKEMCIEGFPGKILENTIRETHIYYSHDDMQVTLEASEFYHTHIVGSELHLFEDRGHFLGTDFPELFACIQKNEG